MTVRRRAAAPAATTCRSSANVRLVADRDVVERAGGDSRSRGHLPADRAAAAGRPRRRDHHRRGPRGWRWPERRRARRRASLAIARARPWPARDRSSADRAWARTRRPTSLRQDARCAGARTVIDQAATPACLSRATSLLVNAVEPAVGHDHDDVAGLPLGDDGVDDVSTPSDVTGAPAGRVQTRRPVRRPTAARLPAASIGTRSR